MTAEKKLGIWMDHADINFSKIKIESKSSDKITENQEKAFVRDYFSKS